MRLRPLPILLALTLLSLSACLRSKKPESIGASAVPTIAAKVATMKALPGFIPLYWDARAGKMGMNRHLGY